MVFMRTVAVVGWVDGLSGRIGMAVKEGVEVEDCGVRVTVGVTIM